MANKTKKYIDRMRRKYKSPFEMQKNIDTKYGTDAEQKMTFKEANKIYDDAVFWASWNDIPMQDYWVRQCGSSYKWQDNPRPFVKKVLTTLEAMVNHLTRGQELGLSELEQRIIDTLWGWVPHNYQENYVDCAREMAKAIVSLAPAEKEKKSEEGYAIFFDKVMGEIKNLAEKYDVEYDTSDYNLTLGYFYEWMPLEYGMIFEHKWVETTDDDDDY